jgi:hypothetical protein
VSEFPSVTDSSSTASDGSILAAALRGTVLTGFRDVAAWNQRFGRSRVTKMVERPLTGQGGQLDSYGNLRD